MTNVGALAANFHEGSRSEYLAQYLLASFGTAVAVPHQEDPGIDLYCTLTERIGKLAWPRYHYTVQVKSTMSPWQFGTAESVRWLVEHPLPLFLCVVDKATARLRLYHTFPRFLVWVTGELPDTLELVPEDRQDGHSTEWRDGKTFSLSAPVLDCTVAELLDDARSAQAKTVIECWAKAQASNLVSVTNDLPIFSMPSEYETNTTGFKGEVYQWNTLPGRLERMRPMAGKMLAWLAEAYRQRDDLRGMARAALLLRYLYPSYEGPKTPDAPFVQPEINKALGLSPSYVFEGVDLLARRFDDLLSQAPPRASAG